MQIDLNCYLLFPIQIVWVCFPTTHFTLLTLTAATEILFFDQKLQVLTFIMVKSFQALYNFYSRRFVRLRRNLKSTSPWSLWINPFPGNKIRIILLLLTLDVCTRQRGNSHRERVLTIKIKYRSIYLIALPVKSFPLRQSSICFTLIKSSWKPWWPKFCSKSIPSFLFFYFIFFFFVFQVG